MRLGTACRTVLVPRYPEYFVVLCGAFLWLVGICASAISASVTIPVQIKRAFLIKPPVFNFVNENTGRSLKLRWPRDCLRLPSVGLALRRKESLACKRIPYCCSRGKTPDVDVPAVWRERTGNQALFSGHGNSVRHVTVSILLGGGCFRHADVAWVRRRRNRSGTW